MCAVLGLPQYQPVRWSTCIDVTIGLGNCVLACSVCLLGPRGLWQSSQGLKVTGCGMGG